MRTSIFAIFFIISAISLPVAAQNTFKYAVDYNDFIINEQNKIGGIINGFMLASGKGKLKEMSMKHDEVIKQIDASTELVKALKPFKNNSSFKNAALDLFAMYKSISQNEYMDIMALVNEGTEVGNNRSKMYQIMMRIEEKSKPVNDAFLAKQAEFAAEFNVNLGENNLEKQQKEVKP